MPPDIYENPFGKDTFVPPTDQGTKVERVEYGNGIHVFLEGFKYPIKGMATQESLWAIDTLKNTTLALLPIAPLALMFPRRFLRAYNQFAFGTIGRYILKPEYRTPFTQEIYLLIKRFLTGLGLEGDPRASGIDKNLAEVTAQSLAHIFEYDNAYRFRLQDLFSETSREMLMRSPIATLTSLIGISKQRDSATVSQKMDRFGTIICMALFIPRIRRAFIDAIAQSDFPKLQLDVEDKYWLCMRKDYNFMGMNYEQRQELMKTL